jgi:hypothetical protein
MNPVDFPQAVKTLGPPQGAGSCGGLRVWTDGEVCVSAWMPTEEERAKIAAGEPVFLWVMFGSTQPPVAIEVGSPFEASELTTPDAEALHALGISPK